MEIDRSTAFKFFEILGVVGYYLVASERNKTIKHLTEIYSNKYSKQKIRKMARNVFINISRNVVDAFRIGVIDSKTIDEFVTASGLEKIDNAMKKQKGVLLITGHIGNWELLGAYLSLKGYPLNVIGAPIYDPRLDELVVKNRQKSGTKYIARGSATREILRALSRKELIGLLIDQDSKKFDGVFVDFMGKQAFTPSGPVILAMRTGAPVLPITIHLRKNYKHVIETGDEIQFKITGNKQEDIVYNTQLCSKAIEKAILKNPTQWVWMHKRWKTKRKNVQ